MSSLLIDSPARQQVSAADVEALRKAAANLKHALPANPRAAAAAAAEYQAARSAFEHQNPTAFTVTVTPPNEDAWMFNLAAPDLAVAQTKASWRLRDLDDVQVTVLPAMAREQVAA